MERIKLFLDNLIKESTPAKPLWNIEHILENKSPKWNYIDGCMLKAIMDMYYATGNSIYLDFAITFIDFYVDEEGNILGYDMNEFNSDSVNEGKVLFSLYDITKKEKYKKAIYNIYEQIKQQPRTKEGNFWHKKIYPNQIWLDGLYMVEPFYMEFEMKFNQKKNYKDIFKQFKNVYNLMRDSSTNLLYHGYDESRESFWACSETGLSKNFWTRSLGWYCMALVDTLEKMDDMLFYEYDTLQVYLKEIVDAVLKYMDKDKKMFYQVTIFSDRPGNYLETSGSAAISYSIMKGVRLGFLPQHYYEYGLEIFNSIVENKLIATWDSFVLKDICLVAGLGGMPGKGDYKFRDGTFEYYIYEPIVENDAKGVAPFLFAFTEVYRNKI